MCKFTATTLIEKLHKFLLREEDFDPAELGLYGSLFPPHKVPSVTWKLKLSRYLKILRKQHFELALSIRKLCDGTSVPCYPDGVKEAEGSDQQEHMFMMFFWFFC